MFANSTGLGSLQGISDALATSGPAQPPTQREALEMTMRGLARVAGPGGPLRRAPALNRSPGLENRSPEEIQQLMEHFRRMMQGRPAGPVAGGRPQPGVPRVQPGAQPGGPAVGGIQTPQPIGPQVGAQSGVQTPQPIPADQGQGGIAGLLQGLQNLRQQQGQGAQAGAQANGDPGSIINRRRARRAQAQQRLQQVGQQLSQLAR